MQRRSGGSAGRGGGRGQGGCGECEETHCMLQLSGGRPKGEETHCMHVLVELQAEQEWPAGIAQVSGNEGEGGVEQLPARGINRGFRRRVVGGWGAACRARRRPWWAVVAALLMAARLGLGGGEGTWGGYGRQRQRLCLWSLGSDSLEARRGPTVAMAETLLVRRQRGPGGGKARQRRVASPGHVGG
jgi:hypothetical protein